MTWIGPGIEGIYALISEVGSCTKNDREGIKVPVSEVILNIGANCGNSSPVE